MELSPTQSVAREKVWEWLNDDTFEVQPIFRIFGYAGTGKTSIIRSLTHREYLDDGPLGIAYAAYTGKAAMVMRNKGIPATTIHSLIYKPVAPSKKYCDELLKEAQAATSKKEKSRLYNELASARKVTFELRSLAQCDLSQIGLLVLDECSMVNDQMKKDLLSFKVPLLVLGDPEQLPPIEGTGALTRAKPDILLTEIHRQAKGNPIIDFATRSRKGIPIPRTTEDTAELEGEYALHIPKTKLTQGTSLLMDQILTGKNVTRRMINIEMRQMIGCSRAYPETGEKLICLANDRIRLNDGSYYQVFNGMMGTVVSDEYEEFDTAIAFDIRFEDQSPHEEPIHVRALKSYFDAYHTPDAMRDIRWWDRKNTQEFDFGYAITVHKAQGSQWDSVLLYDDGFLSWKPNERKRWLYTAITRAERSIIIAD